MSDTTIGGDPLFTACACCGCDGDRLRARITHLTAAIATHHATRWTAGRAVLSPPDQALYDAAGEAYRVLDWDAGGDVVPAGGVADVLRLDGAAEPETPCAVIVGGSDV